MAKNNAFLGRIEAEMKMRENEARHVARVFQLDMVTIALGRMGWGEKRFEKFDKMLTEVTMEYSHEILDDQKSDKDCWKSKADLDRELQQYVGKRFVPYEERYG